jgi:hypothetical protein
MPSRALQNGPQERLRELRRAAALPRLQHQDHPPRLLVPRNAGLCSGGVGGDGCLGIRGREHRL